MDRTRLQRLLNFLEEEPNNPFNRYALALEYMNIDLYQAKIYFDELLQKQPDYLATYYQAGKLYEELEDMDRAKDIYERGIQLAKTQENNFTLRELKNAYQQLLDEEEYG